MEAEFCLICGSDTFEKFLELEKICSQDLRTWGSQNSKVLTEVTMIQIMDKSFHPLVELLLLLSMKYVLISVFIMHCD